RFRRGRRAQASADLRPTAGAVERGDAGVGARTSRGDPGASRQRLRPRPPDVRRRRLGYPMRTIERGADLVIEDSPGLYWILALLFIGVGSVFVVGPLGLFVNAKSVSLAGRAASVIIGAAGVAAGIWLLKGSPRSRLLFSRADARVRITRTG